MKNLMLILVLGCLAPLKAIAYPHFIGHGYPSCLNCHYNPMGNGPLTDYGRVVAANGIASSWAYPKSWSEEKVAETAAKPWQAIFPKWMRAQANYRGLYLISGPGTATQRTDWIHMQGSGQLVLQFLEDDRLTVVGEIGYAPPPQQVTAGEARRYLRSREHYVGYRLNPEWGVYAGFMDQAYGLRVVEHLLFSRTVPQVGQNDQSHGVMVHYLDDQREFAVHALAGNLFQDRDLRQMGGSAWFEHQVGGDHRVGGSFKHTFGDYKKLTSASIHTRFNLKEGSALLFEAGQTFLKTDNRSGELISRFGLLQAYLRPTRGFYVVTHVEYLKSDVSSPSTTLRWGPGLQFFPVQRVQFRFDAYNSRNFNPEASTSDSWVITFQTHVWI